MARRLDGQLLVWLSGGDIVGDYCGLGTRCRQTDGESEEMVGVQVLGESMESQ